MEDPLIGKNLGNYRIDSVIGRGGMATVYYGFDESLHRPVAVKVIDARYRDNNDYTDRFLQEARTVATWRHDNILQVFYAGQEEELYYFAMEYVDGPDLNQVMKQYVEDGELMPQEDVLKIGQAVAQALDYAHNQEIIHRDVKPSNVMIAKNGRIALADFGLALNTQQGSFGGTFGTPHYIAPEQARNSALAVPQSDLYSLGVMLYEMLTGSVPFDDPSPTSLAIQHLTQPPPPPRQMNPNLNQATEDVLLKALDKQVEARFQTGTELMEALAAALLAPAAFAEAVALPPLPSGVAATTAQSLSQMSLAERVSLYMPPPPPAVQTASPSSRPTPSPAVPPPAAPPAPSNSDLKRSPYSWVGMTIIVILLLAAIGWIIFGRGDSEENTAAALDPTPTTGAQTEREPTTVATRMEPEPTATVTAVPPTPTDGDEAALVDPERTSTPVPTNTAVPATSTPVPEPTITPSATEGPATLPTATPTGPRLVMIYDSTSFYLYNPNANSAIRVSQLIFESLDENGNPSGYWFDGRRWSQFYSFVEPFQCDRLEITKVSGWLRPSQCRQYNASVTPEQDGDIVFWTERPGVSQFRVLWQSQEIGRCDVVADQCEVYLP